MLQGWTTEYEWNSTSSMVLQRLTWALSLFWYTLKSVGSIDNKRVNTFPPQERNARPCEQNIIWTYGVKSLNNWLSNQDMRSLQAIFHEFHWIRRENSILIRLYTGQCRLNQHSQRLGLYESRWYGQTALCRKRLTVLFYPVNIPENAPIWAEPHKSIEPPPQWFLYYSWTVNDSAVTRLWYIDRKGYMTWDFQAKQ